MAPRSLVPRLPARTLATQVGMTNKWLTEQGLISVKDQWVKIHYSAFGPITLMKRPVRSRTQGVVGAGGKNPRLPD